MPDAAAHAPPVPRLPPADECLAALAAAVPQLATLNLQGCKGLGDDGVAHLGALPCLRHVLLPPGVSDASMQLLALMPGARRCVGRPARSAALQAALHCSCRQLHGTWHVSALWLNMPLAAPAPLPHLQPWSAWRCAAAA